MAEVSELVKLNRDQLNEFAQQNGVADAADESKYVTKKDLAEAVAPNVTPEALEAYKSGNSAPQQDTLVHNGEGAENASDEVTSPENPPVDDEPKSDEQKDVEQNAEDAAEALGVNEPAQTLDTPPIDSADDVDDQSGVEDAPTQADDDDDEEDEADQEANRIQSKGAPQASDEEGMGFPRSKGKTLSIFSKKPHETVRNVGGVMVPLTNEEAVGDAQKGIAPKSDAEIIAKLRKLGKM